MDKLVETNCFGLKSYKAFFIKLEHVEPIWRSPTFTAHGFCNDRVCKERFSKRNVFAIIIGWILEFCEQRHREKCSPVEGWRTPVGMQENDNVSAMNPFVTILSWGFVLKCFTTVTAHILFTAYFLSK